MHLPMSWQITITLSVSIPCLSTDIFLTLQKDHMIISASSVASITQRKRRMTLLSLSSLLSRVCNFTTNINLFYSFPSFKGWKRLLLADGPRQVINALTLYSFYLSQKDKGDFWDLNKYTNGSIITGALIFSTLMTVIIFAGSALLLLAAGICYIPLLCYIRGNLKEYCCHKVDKVCSTSLYRAANGETESFRSVSLK